MFDKILSLIAPHLCFGCAKVDTILCDRCIQNNLKNIWSCTTCKIPADCRCAEHLPLDSGPWVIAERQGVLKKVIDAYKFERTIEAHKVLGSLLDMGLPLLPDHAVIIPVPTIPQHTRSRGYDHCALMVRDFARRRNLHHAPLLRRRNSSQQRGASRCEREMQAAHAFMVQGEAAPDRLYVIIDDITTTGATLAWAAQALKDSGATTVWTVAIAQQPLDD